MSTILKTYVVSAAFSLHALMSAFLKLRLHPCSVALRPLLYHLRYVYRALDSQLWEALFEAVGGFFSVWEYIYLFNQIQYHHLHIQPIHYIGHQRTLLILSKDFYTILPICQPIIVIVL